MNVKASRDVVRPLAASHPLVVEDAPVDGAEHEGPA
jgi:hypothetical protein